MPLKSIYEIEVNDQKFRDFQALFSKFQDQVKAGGSAGLGGVGNAAEKLAKSYTQQANQAKKLADALLGSKVLTAAVGVEAEKTAKALKTQADEMARIATEARRAMGFQEKFAHSVGSGAKQMRDMATSAKSMAGHIMHGTHSLLRFASVSTVVSGLAGVGSPFGLDRLAGGVSSRRFGAQGLGITAAQQQAFGLAYGRFFSPDQVLANVVGAQHDWSRRWAFAGLGINPASIDARNPVDLAGETAIRAKRIFDASDQSQQFAQAHGLLEFYTMDDLRRLHAMPMADLERARAQTKSYSQSLRIPDQQQKAWQDFSYQLKLAGDKIENAFVVGLSPLVDGPKGGALGELSNDVAETIKAFLGTPELKTWIHEFGDGLKWAADLLGSKQFRQDIRGVATDINYAAKQLVKGMVWIGLIPDPAAAVAPGGTAVGPGLTGATGLKPLPGLAGRLGVSVGKAPWADHPFRWLWQQISPFGSADTGGDDFFRSIAGAEGTLKNGRIDYDMAYGGQTTPKPLSQMTIAEAMAWAKATAGNPALGGFQIKSGTLGDAATGLGIPATHLFDPATQRRAAAWIAAHQGLGAWTGFATHPELRQKVQAAGIPRNPLAGMSVGNPVDAMAKLAGTNGAAVRDYLRDPQGVIARDPALGLWCAEFVNAYLRHAGVPGTNSLLAKSFANWGQLVDPAHLHKGDILLNRNGAHVGVATGRTRIGAHGLEIEEMSSNTLGPNGAAQNLPGLRWRSDVEIRRSNALAKAQAQWGSALADARPATAGETPPPGGALPATPGGGVAGTAPANSKVTIAVHNQTGGSAIVSAAQLAVP